MIKRFVFGNLIYHLNNANVLLVNLISFRRQKLSSDLFSNIIEIENKINKGVSLSEDESKILNKLYDDKQILSNDVVLKIEKDIQNVPELIMDKFLVKGYTINLTHECNFRCSYCYQNKYKDKLEYRQFMTVKDIDLIKEYLSQSIFNTDEIEEIVFTGGESLLPQNIDTINYALKNLKAKKFKIFTNGVNLFDYRKYIDYNLIDEFQISFDGTPEIIKCVNKNIDSTAFNKIINGIKHIESLNKEISVVVMWTRELEQYIDEFINALKENDITKKPNMRIRFNLVRDNYSINGIDKDFYDINYLCDLAKRINPKLSQIGSFIEIYNEGTSLGQIIYKPANERSYLKYKRCNISNAVSMVFEPNGEIFFCLCLGNKNGLIGNYKENIYFDKDKVLKFGNRTIVTIEKCKSCELKYLCAGGCPLPLTSFNSDLNKPVCGLYGLDEFWNRLEEIV